MLLPHDHNTSHVIAVAIAVTITATPALILSPSFLRASVLIGRRSLAGFHDPVLMWLQLPHRGCGHCHRNGFPRAQGRSPGGSNRNRLASHRSFAIATVSLSRKEWRPTSNN